MGYNLGIDIGIASVGFAGVAENEIMFAGVHIFDTAEQPKTGASLALPRREARGQRRVIRRKASRKKAIRRLLTQYGISIDSIDEVQKKGEIKKSVWELRTEALDRKLMGLSRNKLSIL